MGDVVTHRGSRRRRSWGKDHVRAVLSLGIVLGLGAVGTLAAWTDDATATATFSTGTIDIRLTAANLETATIDVSMTNMIPGAAKAATITVRNRGTVPFAYAINGAGTDTTGTGLGAALRFNVFLGGTPNPTTGACDAPTTKLTAPVVGTGAQLAASMVTGRALAKLGDSGADETLCVSVFLPSTADTSLQTKAATATLTFAASTS